MQVRQVTYGAFEALPRPSQAPRPTFDLTPFFVLRDWTAAIALLDAGDFRALGGQLRAAAEPLGRLLQKRNPAALRKLPGALEGLGQALWNNRLRRIGSRVGDLSRLLSDVIDDFARLATLARADQDSLEETALAPIVGALQPMTAVLTRSQDVVATLLPADGDPAEVQGLLAAQFCAEHGLLVQALNLLRESLTDHVLRKLAAVDDLDLALDREPDGPDMAEVADHVVGWLTAPAQTPPDPKRIPAAVVQGLTDALGGAESRQELVAIACFVVDRRNSFNHAWVRLKRGRADMRDDSSVNWDKMQAEVQTQISAALVLARG